MNSPRSSFSSALLLSPCMTRIFTAVWLSRLVVKIFVRCVGTVVFCGMSSSKMLPNVMMPSACGVTSSRIISCLSSMSAAPWIAAPSATTSSGCTPLHGSRSKNFATAFWIFGMRVMPPTRTTSSISSFSSFASSSVCRQMSTVRSMRSSESSSSV